MIRIAVVDDDDNYILIIKNELTDILSKISYDKYEIQTFTDGGILLESNDRFDLFLLDIDMPTINGFDLAVEFSSNNVSSGNYPTIIYISNYEDLVFESFKYSPLRFVRKKKLKDDLEEAIIAFLKKRKNNSHKLLFSTALGKRSVLVNDIMYIEVTSHKLNIHIGEQKIIANGNLKDIEESLREYGFIKTHQSYMVNFRYINFIRHSEVILDDGTTIPLSRGRYEQVKKDYIILTREQ